MLGWWYTRGWVWVAKHLLQTRNTRIAEFFSITALLKTLFAPFRQDSVDSKGAPIGYKLQVLGGNIISRFLGLMIRLILILCGVILIVLNTLLGIIVVCIWPLIPFAPLVVMLLILLNVGLVNV